MKRHVPWHLLQLIMVAIALVVGLGLQLLLERLRQDPEKQTIEQLAPLVEVLRAQTRDVPVVVRGFGTVRPSVSVDVMPQVEGTVVELHPALQSGGFFAADELLIGIDPTDYELAVEQADADLAQAEAASANAVANVDAFKARRDDAQIESQRANELYAKRSAPERERDRADLLLRQVEAELRAARAMHQRAAADRRSAETRLKIARVRLARTQITLPFDGRVDREQVDVGQFVAPGQILATVYGTDTLEVPVPLQDWELAWFDVPQRPDQTPGSHAGAPVTVAANFAGQPHQWAGRAARVEGQVDHISRMVNVVVTVDEPVAEHRSDVMLMPGMFVELEIKGRTLSNVVTIPRRALRTADQVWIAENDTLRFRRVEVARRERDAVHVRGLEAGQLLVITNLDIVTDGMRIRIGSGPDE